MLWCHNDYFKLKTKLTLTNAYTTNDYFHLILFDGTNWNTSLIEMYVYIMINSNTELKLILTPTKYQIKMNSYLLIFLMSSLVGCVTAWMFRFRSSFSSLLRLDWIDCLSLPVDLEMLIKLTIYSSVELLPSGSALIYTAVTSFVMFTWYLCNQDFD